MTYHPIVTGTPDEILGELHLWWYVLTHNRFPCGAVPSSLNKETIGLRTDALFSKLKAPPRPLFAPKGM